MNVPPGACDCHVHVFGPAARYPLAPDRAYTPPEASLEELLELQQRLGFERVVIVQPSVYGADNSCTLDALRKLGGRARGVAVAEAATPLEGMHAAGIRGVRVNLQTGNLRDPGPLARALVAAAPERCIWGSDWPHPVSGPRNPKAVQPFDRIDDLAALERLHGWIGDEALFRKILVDNPARLYDF